MDQMNDPTCSGDQNPSPPFIAPDPVSGRQQHATLVEFFPSVPSDVNVGADVTFKITVTCPSGCDLRSRLVILTANSLETSVPLISFDGRINATEDLTIAAPAETGEYVWSALVPKQGSDDGLHQEGGVSVTLRTRPHRTSIAVWDVPSPVVMDTAFTLKVGIRCATGCLLAGRVVEICDEAGDKVGEGRLADTPWLGTESLYWASVDVTAPAQEGVFFLNASLAAEPSGLAHEPARGRFSCRTARPPEHRLTIAVTGKVTGRPIDDVEVRAGHYERFTDDRGVATIEVPGGTYALSIRKDGFMAEPLTVDVDGDLTVPIQAAAAVSKAVTESPVGPHHPYRD